MALIRDVIDRVLFPNREQHVIPMLDGPFSPNSRLDASRVLGPVIEAPDDLVGGDDGVLYVSSEDRVLRCTGPDFEQRSVFARLRGAVTGLTRSRDGRLLAAVSGLGLVALSPEGTVVGHVHLQVGRVDAAEEFWTKTIGMQVMAHYPGAAFLSSGGYHHHIGANVWNSRNAAVRNLPATGLAELELLAEPAEFAAIAARAGERPTDPWGTTVALTRKAA